MNDTGSLRRYARTGLLAPFKIADSSGDFKYPSNDLLYIIHACPEVVSTVTIRWASGQILPAGLELGSDDLSHKTERDYLSHLPPRYIFPS